MHRFPIVPMVRHTVAVKLLDKAKAHRELPPPSMRRAIRIGAGVTQQDIADEQGVTRAAVSRWESGERQPRGDDLLAYVAILKSLQDNS